ncbi:hypothetical protein [Flavisphingomonas formosensis]|uniref:hypothetical protein n=1 Tax=Flavisphingomonas formosensis TaxID=861534 RepID=UPI001E5897B1|nr:hypothetical protein [Sphingomonas formosensis]
MERIRKTLSLKLDRPLAAGPTPDVEVVRQAIVHHLCLRATYNRGMIILAPHILYEKHGEPHVDGVVIERNDAKPLEQKLGTFKVSGLRAPVTISEAVTPIAGFDPRDARYAERTIAVLEL